MAAWDSLIAPNFTETNDITATGNVRVGFTSYGMHTPTQDYWGITYSPPYHAVSPSPDYEGDVWIDSGVAGSTFATGTLDWENLLHETGHALGLKHPFDAPVLAGGDTYDSTRFTLMSYTETGEFVRSFTLDGGGALQLHAHQAFANS